MSQNALIAVTTDAIRGLLQAAVGEAARITLSHPAQSREGGDALGLQLLRIGLPPMIRSVPVIGADGRRLHAVQNLQLDYLLDPRTSDPLQGQHLLGCALAALARQPSLDVPVFTPLLSRPDLLQSLLPAALGITLRALELPLGEQATLWSALAAPAHAALFWRAEVTWQAQ